MSDTPLSWRDTAAVLGLVALTLLLRRPDSLLRPQFYCEDGIIFFWQAYERGGAAALFVPYAGYLHLIPRLFAWAGEALPILWRPAFDNYGALALTLGWTAMLCRYVRLDLRGAERVALALATVLVPQGGEVFLTLSNLQWMQVPLLVALILQRPARTRGQLWVEGALLLVGGLTGPMIIFLLPLFAVRWWRHGWYGRGELVLLLPALGAAAIQTWLIAHSERVQFQPPTLAARPWLKALGFELPGRLFLGDQVPELLGNAFWVLTPALLVAAGLLVWRGAATDGGHRRRLALVCLFTGAIFLAAALRTVAHDPLILQPLASGSRYCYVPYVMAAWALVLLYGGVPPGWPRRLAGGLLASMLLASATRFTAPRQPNFHWARQAQHLQAGEATTVRHPALGPEGWYFEVQARVPTSPR